MKEHKLKKQLQDIINDKPKTIEAHVAQEALENENIIAFFSDLQHHGCVSGMVSSLVYYCDTHAFYDEFYDEIEELRLSHEDMIGEPIKINGDMKNFFAWFAFEETAYRISIKVL